MLTNLLALVRVAVVALVFGFVFTSAAHAQRSGATPRDTVATAASRTGRNAGEEAGEYRGDPTAGWIWAVGAVAVVVFLAWLAMRIGDQDTPSDKVPN